MPEGSGPSQRLRFRRCFTGVDVSSSHLWAPVPFGLVGGFNASLPGRNRWLPRQLVSLPLVPPIRGRTETGNCSRGVPEGRRHRRDHGAGGAARHRGEPLSFISDRKVFGDLIDDERFCNGLQGCPEEPPRIRRQRRPSDPPTGDLNRTKRVFTQKHQRWPEKSGSRSSYGIWPNPAGRNASGGWPS